MSDILINSFISFPAAAGGIDTVVDSVTASNYQAAKNKFYWLDVSGLTANRDFLLPTGPSTGDFVGVGLSAGDDTYELLIKSGAAGDLIDGVDRSSSEWSRLFHTGELLYFRCISGATADWIVESDRRLVSRFYAYRATDLTTHAAGTIAAGFDTEAYDVGSVYNTSTEQFESRRAGVWAVGMAIQNYANHPTTNAFIGCSLPSWRFYNRIVQISVKGTAHPVYTSIYNVRATSSQQASVLYESTNVGILADADQAWHCGVESLR
jgi:hypothetical protein